jgi:tellurite resistance protein TehA-like permease
VDAAFQILTIVVFMALVVGLAALVLWLLDKRTLPKGASQEERKAFVDQRTGSWQDRCRKGMAIMAALSIIANVAALITRSDTSIWCVIWIALASAFLLSQWNPYRRKDRN